MKLINKVRSPEMKGTQLLKCKKLLGFYCSRCWIYFAQGIEVFFLQECVISFHILISSLVSAVYSIKISFSMIIVI